MKALLYSYLFILPIYPALSFITIRGYPIVTLLNIIMLPILVLAYLFQNKTTILQFFLLACTAVSFLISVMSGWTAESCYLNLCMYMIPILIFALVDRTGISLKVFTWIMTASLFVAAVLSILALVGLLPKTSGYYVNIYYVDGAAGLIGIALCIYQAVSADRKFKLLQTILLGVCGSIVVLLGQSRARFLIALLSAILMLFLMVNKHSGEERSKIAKRVFTFILFAGVIVLFGYLLIPSVSQYIDNIFDRLSALAGEDENLSSRQTEAALYLDLFKEKLLTGQGWGMLNNPDYLRENGNQYRAHNMFAGLLGVGGLLFCVPYFSYLLVQFKNLLSRVVHSDQDSMILGFTAMFDVFVLGIGSAGFGKLSGSLFMALVYICLAANHPVAEPPLRKYGA